MSSSKQTAQHHEDNAAWFSRADRFDGFDRGDLGKDNAPDAGSRVIGRMTSGGGYRVTVTELWSGCDAYYEVHVDGSRVHFTEDREQAVTVARWWMAGCPA